MQLPNVIRLEQNYADNLLFPTVAMVRMAHFSWLTLLADQSLTQRGPNIPRKTILTTFLAPTQRNPKLPLKTKTQYFHAMATAPSVYTRELLHCLAYFVVFIACLCFGHF